MSTEPGAIQPPLSRGTKPGNDHIAPQSPENVQAQPQGARKEAPAVSGSSLPVAAPAVPSKTVPLPAIPDRPLTQKEREAIALAWFAQRFDGRNPAHVKVEEVTAEEMAWLERLWGVSAPINPRTNKPYQHKGFTPIGRPIYDRPFPPPNAFPVEGGEDEDYVILDEDLRADMLRWGARLVVSEDFKTDLCTVLPDGELSVPFPRRDVNGILRGMMPDIARIGRRVQEQKQSQTAATPAST